MKLLNCAALAAVLALSICAPVHAAPTWTEGVNYFLVVPARPTSLPAGKVEVTEVFSYACPACNLFVPTMHKLKASLPPNAVLDYLPASFNPSEDWPMFQLAYLTAQTLGVAEQTHDTVFDAVWPCSILRPGVSRVTCRPSRMPQSSTRKKQACPPTNSWRPRSRLRWT